MYATRKEGTREHSLEPEFPDATAMDGSSEVAVGRESRSELLPNIGVAERGSQEQRRAINGIGSGEENTIGVVLEAPGIRRKGRVERVASWKGSV